MSDAQRPNIEPLDLSERGANGQSSQRRLFMQLQVFTGCSDSAAVVEAMEMTGVPGVMYEDVNDPMGVGIVTYTEEPEDFVGEVRRLYNGEPFVRLERRGDFTMIGRTYTLGYEPNVEETLIQRPLNTLRKEQWNWAVWYPLRRRGSFARLLPEEQREVLMEHGKIGMQYGGNDLAHDIRLACHGLDTHDNDFVVGVVGRELAPLSKLVETMRKTQQTSLHIERLGPFFVGRKVWQSAE